MIRGKSRREVTHVEGFLHKKSPKSIMGMHRWQVRYFVLLNERLEYYKGKGDAKPIGSIPTNMISNVIHQKNKRNGARFDITIDGDCERVFSLMAEDKRSCKNWVISLKNILNQVPRNTIVRAAGGKTPWKNLELITNSQGVDRLPQFSNSKEMSVKDLGYICGKKIFQFKQGFGSVYQVSKAKSRFHGLLHVVPQGTNHADDINQFFADVIERDTSCTMTAMLKGTTSDSHWIIYEHGKCSIYSHLKRNGKFSERKARTLAAEIAVGLEAHHEEKRWFPNLRPENVFLSRHGHVLLVDLWHTSGFGREAEGNLRSVVSEYITPDYFTHQEDALSDWWRLGVILYEMLYGIPPFCSMRNDNNEVIQMIKNYSNDPKASPLKFPADASPSAKELITALLSDRKSRKQFRDLTTLQNHAFFEGTDFKRIKYREGKAAADRARNRRRDFETRYDVTLSLQGARDLRFGNLGITKSVYCSATTDTNEHLSPSAPYSMSKVEFKANSMTFSNLGRSHMFTIRCHGSGSEGNSTATGSASLTFGDIISERVVKRGTQFEKWIDTFSGDSSLVGDVCVSFRFTKLHLPKTHQTSTKTFKQFFQVPEGHNENFTALDVDIDKPNEDEEEQEELEGGGNMEVGGGGGGAKIFNVVRGLVSKKKKRFRKDNFDLDLSYITSRLIAMGFPSENMAGIYRNPMPEVQRFFQQYHEKKFKIYNLCSEKQYPKSKFGGAVAEYGFDDHQCPDLKVILDFCRDVDKYLSENDEYVIAAHCKAGKGRTGLMLACYMVYAGICPSARVALNLFATERTNNNKGVTIPSQRRYVYYFERFLREYHWPEPPRYFNLNGAPVTLYHIRVSLVNGEVPMVKINDTKGRLIYEHTGSKSAMSGDMKRGKQTLKHAELGCRVALAGDLKLTFSVGKQEVFWLWMNTGFVESNYACFTKKQMDNAVKDKNDRSLPKDLMVELFFLPEEETRHRSNSA